MKDLDLTRVEVIDFLEALDIRNIEEVNGREALFSCPFAGHSHGDESPSAYMNLENTKWMCHGCKKRGNAITFLSDLENISPVISKRFIRERYDSSFKEPEGGSISYEIDRKLDERKQGKIKNEPIGDLFDRDWDVDWMDYKDESDDDPDPVKYMMGERGFQPAVLNDWEVGVDWEISQRIAIPVKDAQGNLIGFKGRAYKENHRPKYLVLGDDPDKAPRYGFPRYLISQVVFGADRCEPYEGNVIVCEGELNVIALYQHGFNNAVAVNGSNFSDRQCQIILELAETVTVFFDSDVSGNIGQKIVVKQLERDIPVSVVPEHNGDPASLDYESVAACIGSAQSTIMGLS